MKQVFLSYSFEGDREFVQNLKRSLSDFVLTEPSDWISPESDLGNSIASAIRRSDIVLALIPRDRPNLMLEVGFALGARKPTLLVVDSDTRLPIELQTVPCVVRSGNSHEDISEINRRLQELPINEEKSAPRFSDPRDILETHHANPEFFERLEHAEFEKALMEFFNSSGIKTEPSQHKDTGFDFMITSPSDGTRVLVEAKKLGPQSRVSIGDVSTLASSIAVSGANSGMLISNSDFTTSARNLAENSGGRLMLYTLDQILSVQDPIELFGTYGSIAR